MPQLHLHVSDAIAATALAHDAVVVTSNPRAFARVPFLVTEDWRHAA